jgi:hypothetical protein
VSDIEVDFDIVASNGQLLSKFRLLAEERTPPVDDIDGNDEDERDADYKRSRSVSVPGRQYKQIEGDKSTYTIW